MASALRVSSSFLNGIKAMFPDNSANAIAGQNPVLRNPWYIVAAVAFSASNRPEAVPQVFENALADLRDADNTLGNSNVADIALGNRKLLANRFREALFKSGLTSGYPKAINSLKSLHESIPEELWETEIQRNTARSLPEVEAAGVTFFDQLYGEEANPTQTLLDSIYPDMGWFSKTIGYGLVYENGKGILSPLETSYTLVAALISVDTPLQSSWHLANARRIGASVEEVNAVREATIQVATLSGVQWRHPIPELKL